MKYFHNNSYALATIDIKNEKSYLKYKDLFKGKKWVLKNELLNYLEHDILGLLEVMLKFNKIIFDNYKKYYL